MDYNRLKEECNNLENEMEENRKGKIQRIKWRDTRRKEFCEIFLIIMNNMNCNRPGSVV